MKPGFTYKEILIAAAVTSVIVSLLIVHYPYDLAAPVGDFTNYWASLRLLLSQYSLYDEQLLRLVAIEFDPNFPLFERVPGPPHQLMLLLPILWLPYQWSLFAFRTVCLLSLFLCTFSLLQKHAPFAPVQLVKILLALLLFTPFIHAWGWPQSSFLLLMSHFLLYLSLREGRYYGATLFAAAVLGSIKPHVTVVPLCMFAILVWQRGHLRNLLLGLLGVVVFFLCFEALFQGVFHQWLHFITNPNSSGQFNLLRRRPASLTFLVQELFLELRGAHPFFSSPNLNATVGIFWISSLIAAIVLALRTRVQPEEKFLLAGALGLLFSPYLWASDMIIALPLYLHLLTPWFFKSVSDSRRHYVVLVLFATATFWGSQVVYATSLFYLPPLIVFCAFWALPRTTNASLPRCQHSPGIGL